MPDNKQRSESTENEVARRDLHNYPPVTILGDLIGRYDPGVGSQNALTDAIRQVLMDKMTATGGRPTDNMGAVSTYNTPEGTYPAAALQRVIQQNTAPSLPASSTDGERALWWLQHGKQ